MSFLRSVVRPCAFRCTPLVRTYTSKAPTSALGSETAAPAAPDASTAPSEDTLSLSACAPNTVLTGLNWLKGQPPVLALPDTEYPPWLWKLLEPKKIEDTGPGSQAEKVRLRKENRQRIRDQNFMKTQ